MIAVNMNGPIETPRRRSNARLTSKWRIRVDRRIPLPRVCTSQPGIADTVTGMNMEKHAFRAGIRAMPGDERALPACCPSTMRQSSGSLRKASAACTTVPRRNNPRERDRVFSEVILARQFALQSR
ncbi:hypothetical protein [Accumulibacter sp.]|uniref:hypothetical protein n=1 Tax=Accumulibacter sp. TaxID=2053492 RepID=UPI0025CD4DFE|nr:hypothetical protein [Accumulibacter sp.]MCM8613965.1 hypothetical protein [Accumulibacter sp.]MCM8637772.1 hypothetical protein [Accumulibacter sp.]MCM8638817.1 hypothetical protein [Accumulibacter sp.]